MVGTGLAGGSAAATLGRAGLPREVVLLPGQPAPRALDRRAGRHQRREELPQRRRQRLPAVLRHGQGRRLPRPRVQRAPPRRGQRRDHRPVRRAGRAVRPRVRRPARHPLASAARRCPRTFYARGQTGQQLLLGAYQALERQIAAGTRQDVPPPRDARAGRRRRPRPRHRRARPGHRRDRDRTSPTRSCWPPAATATSSTSRPTPRAATSPRPGARTARARCSRTRATPRSTRPASRSRGDHQSKLTLMSESLRNDGRVWVPQGERRRPRRRTTSPRTSATTTWSASTRRSATSCRATSPRAPPRRSATRGAASARAGWASTSTSPTRSRGSAASAVEAVRQPVRDVRAHHRRGPVRGRRCGSTRPCTTRWAGCGSTTTCSRTIPGLFVVGEANFSDHGANRLGASALMQGLADGYFVLPVTIGDYLARRARSTPVDRDTPAVAQAAAGVTDRHRRLLSINGAPARSTRSTASSAADVGATAAWSAPRRAAQGAGADPGAARGVLDATSRCRARRGAQPGAGEGRPRRRLPGARRADVPRRAAPRRVLRRPLPRGEPDRRRRGPARRRELRLRRGLGVHRRGEPPVLHKEDLVFDHVHPSQRSYK